MTEKKNYKSTLNLPQTDFSMRANLANREPEVVKAWEEAGVYKTMIARRKEQGATPFILHDGPPYANGNIHHGHILNKVLKDFVVKYRNLAGFVAEYVPGWDCHGLPIEHQVDKNLGKKKREMTKVQIRQACREYADEFVGIQRDEFKRVLVLGDWDNPYRTMDYSYEAKTVRELGEIFDRGLAYQALKPVHWDWAAQTALAEAEVEYDEFTTEHVYVKFPFDQFPESLAANIPEGCETFVVIWTTTPWTLPANLAIALNPELTYQLVRRGDEVYVLAGGLRDSVAKDCRWEAGSYEVLCDFEGRELVGELEVGKGLAARHAFIDRESVLLPADYVTLEQGTGCVHTAPGHGQEDFQLGQHFGLGVVSPVNQYGKFVEADGTEGFVGVQVHKANPKIVEMLHEKGRLLNQPGDKVTIDRYPHGWRSKKPVIFRATTQWFIAMEPESAGQDADYKLRERALSVIDEVEWLPSWGRERIFNMVSGRPDWCISRQRSWGVPITALHCNDCQHVLATKALADHVADLVEEQGVDVWFSLDPTELVPEGTTCPGCGGTDWAKEEDILDVWFDSGVSWSAVLETQLGIGDRADLYLEGSDQHRGWFQSSLMCGLLSRDQSPYKACLTHGFVVDETGRKYSKSSKNFSPPQAMLDKYGAEILRLWVAAVDYRAEITLSETILKRISDSYRKIRNTSRFLLGSLNDFDPNTDMVPLEELEEIDRWVLGRAADAVARIEKAFEEYQFHTVYNTLVQFATVDLSNVYMDVTKDRMYCEQPDGALRRSGQTAYWLVLDALVRAFSPILSFTAQELWEMMPRKADAPEYVFHADFPKEAAAWTTLVDEARWETLLEIRGDVQKALEAKRGSKKDKKPGQIGSSQEAELVVTATGSDLALLQDVGTERLTEYFIVSKVTLQDGEVTGEDVRVDVQVTPSDSGKCPRCWNYWVAPASEDETCPRCTTVVQNLEG